MRRKRGGPCTAEKLPKASHCQPAHRRTLAATFFFLPPIFDRSRRSLEFHAWALASYRTESCFARASVFAWRWHNSPFLHVSVNPFPLQQTRFIPPLLTCDVALRVWAGFQTMRCKFGLDALPNHDAAQKAFRSSKKQTSRICASSRCPGLKYLFQMTDSLQLVD